MNTDTIFECNDHREYLKRYLSARKTPGGLRALAKKAGFKSPGHLTLLINGKRSFTPRSADLLAEAVALKGRKKLLFLAFAKFEAAKTEKDKSAAFEEIVKFKSSKPEFQLESKQYTFLATWYYPVIFVLLQQEAGSHDPLVLAKRIGNNITAAQVLKALVDLNSLGLISKVEDRWNVMHSTLTTSDDIQSSAAAQYHRSSVELSEKALDLPLTEREFNGLTISIPLRLLPTVKQRIRKFRSELNEMLAVENECSKIYQLNLHLFPITDTQDGNRK